MWKNFLGFDDIQMTSVRDELFTYSAQSTAMMRVMSSVGRPTEVSTITMVTSPACGIPAAPMLAAVAVMLGEHTDYCVYSIQEQVLICKRWRSRSRRQWWGGEGVRGATLMYSYSVLVVHYVSLCTFCTYAHFLNQRQQQQKPIILRNRICFAIVALQLFSIKNVMPFIERYKKTSCTAGR